MPGLEHLTAAILAGGLGTRLRSVVADRPKVLAEIGGRPFIEYLLEQLLEAGIRSVVLCTGHLGEQLEATLGSSYKGMSLRYSRESQPLGTGGALRLALDSFSSSPVLVLNGDSYCDARLGQMFQRHGDSKSVATILLSQTEDTRRYGRVQVDDGGRVVQFVEKAETSGPGWVNAGVYLVEREIIAAIEPGQGVSLEREVFPRWIGQGLHGFPCEGRLWDIGVPDAYLLARREFPQIADAHGDRRRIQPRK